MKRLLLAFLFTLAATAANAQSSTATVVATCGTPPLTYTAGQSYAITMDTTGKLCSNSAGGGSQPVTGTVGIDQTTPGSTNGVVVTPATTATGALSHASTTALATSLVAKATPGNLFGYNCSAIAGTGTGMCIVYNATAAPAPGALTGSLVLDFCYISGPGGCSLNRIPMAVNYSAGITVLLSSAASPYTYTTGVLTGAITADYK